MIVILFTFTGCAKEEEVKPKTVFDSNFTLNYNGLQIKGDMSVNEGGEINIETSSPISLKGMKVKIKDDICFVSYKGIQTEFKTADLPESAYFALISSSIKQITNSETLRFEENENGYSASEQTPFGKIEVMLDKEFSITSVVLKSQGFNLKFG